MTSPATLAPSDLSQKTIKLETGTLVPTGKCAGSRRRQSKKKAKDAAQRVSQVAQERAKQAPSPDKPDPLTTPFKSTVAPPSAARSSTAQVARTSPVLKPQEEKQSMGLVPSTADVARQREVLAATNVTADSSDPAIAALISLDQAQLRAFVDARAKMLKFLEGAEQLVHSGMEQGGLADALIVDIGGLQGLLTTQLSTVSQKSYVPQDADKVAFATHKNSYEALQKRQTELSAAMTKVLQGILDVILATDLPQSSAPRMADFAQKFKVIQREYQTVQGETGVVGQRYQQRSLELDGKLQGVTAAMERLKDTLDKVEAIVMAGPGFLARASSMLSGFAPLGALWATKPSSEAPVPTAVFSTLAAPGTTLPPTTDQTPNKLVPSENAKDGKDGAKTATGSPVATSRVIINTSTS